MMGESSISDPSNRGEQRIPVKSIEVISVPEKYYCSIPVVTLAAYDNEKKAYKRDPVGIGSLCVVNPEPDVLILQLSRRDEINNLQFIFTKDSAFTLESGTLIFASEKYGVCAFATLTDGGLSKVYSFLLGLRDGTLQEKIAQENMEKNQKENVQNVLTKLFCNANVVQNPRNYIPDSSIRNITSNSAQTSSTNISAEKPRNQGPKVSRNPKNDKTSTQTTLKGIKISPNELFPQKNETDKKSSTSHPAVSTENEMSVLNDVVASSLFDDLADEEVSRISAAADYLTSSPVEERSSQLSETSGVYQNDGWSHRILGAFIYLLRLERVDDQTLHAVSSPHPQINKIRQALGIVTSSWITPDDLYRIIINGTFDEYRKQRYPNLHLFSGVDATSTLVATANMIRQNRISETTLRCYSRGEDVSDRSKEAASTLDINPRAEIQPTPSVLVPRRRTRIPGSRSPEKTSMSTPTPMNGRRSIVPGHH